MIRNIDTLTQHIDPADDDIRDEQLGSCLITAVSEGNVEQVKNLLDRGADANTVDSEYGTVLGISAYRGDESIVSLLLDRGADANAIDKSGRYGTALGVAVFMGKKLIVAMLLNRGADANTVDSVYGTVLGVAAKTGNAGIVSLLLDRGADINAVRCRYGTALGIAAYMGKKDIVSLLLASRADVIYVGGEYQTAHGEYPTALDAVMSGCAQADLVALVAHAVDQALGNKTARLMRDTYSQHLRTPILDPRGPLPRSRSAFLQRASLRVVQEQRNSTDLRTCLCPNNKVKHRPPFPMPYTRLCGASFIHHHQLQAKTSGTSSATAYTAADGSSLFQGPLQAGAIITPEQANYPCTALNEEFLFRVLRALTGVHKKAAKHFEGWIRKDIRYFVSQDFDFGLAYAASRAAWKHFNNHGSAIDVSSQRAWWLNKAKELDKARTKGIYTDKTGQQLIKSPYSIMPRRLWDLKSNRVVDYRMLHSVVGIPDDTLKPGTDHEPATFKFWAVTHSWTDDMEPIETSVNQYQWPVPVPRGIDLEYDVRAELLSFGAEYVWLDVLCLRQKSNTQKSSNHSSSLDSTKRKEWKIDIPTIGNIYREAERLVRYFNGLGRPFSAHNWGDPRHWLRRAWTLQEIRAENMTFTGGLSRINGQRVIMNTQSEVAGKATTLRREMRPVLKLAEELDSPSGCSAYQLTKEMAKRFATQPTDKVTGLFYLLGTIELPTYDETVSEESSWEQCFHVLPFGRKVEILFDFPYRGTGPGQQWFPTWKQLLDWPERDSDYEHSSIMWPQDRKAPPQPPLALPPEFEFEFKAAGCLFIPNVLVSSPVLLHQTGDPNEYEVEIGDKVFGFYCPYRSQEAIQTTNEPLVLAALSMRNSHNWVVCKPLRYRKGEGSDRSGAWEMTVFGFYWKVLKKVGVLRTDSCSEFLVDGNRPGDARPMLTQTNCLFV